MPEVIEFKILPEDRMVDRMAPIIKAACRVRPDLIPLRETSFARYQDGRGRMWSAGCSGPSDDLTWRLIRDLG